MIIASCVASAACNVYDGANLPGRSLAQAGDSPGARAGSGPDSETSGTADGGDRAGFGGNAGFSEERGGGSGLDGHAGSAAVGVDGGTTNDAGRAGLGATAGGGAAAGVGGGAGNGGMAGGAGTKGGVGGAGSTLCVLHPLTQRSLWRATASSSDNGSPASNAIDGNLSDRWSTGLEQSSADWLQLDFGATVEVDRVTLELGNNPSDFPRGYAVRFSAASNDTAAPVLLKGAGQQATDTVLDFGSPVSGRYLLITQTGSVKALWWSVAEIAVACSH